MKNKIFKDKKEIGRFLIVLLGAAGIGLAQGIFDLPFWVEWGIFFAYIFLGIRWVYSGRIKKTK